MLLSSGDFAVYHAETHVFNLLAPRFGNLAIRANREKLMNVWLQTDYFRRTGLERDEIKGRVLAECSSAGDFLRIMMESIARKQNVRRWAECTPDHLLYLREIKQSIPDALVIHMIRDGRDVAMSVAKQGWVRTFPWDSGRSLMASGLYWEWIVKRGREFGRTMGADYLEVRFEDLNLHPQESLTAIGAFIDHELDYEKILKVGLGSVSQPNTSFRGKDDGKDQAFNPVGRWRSLPPEQTATLEFLLGELLRELRYEVSDERAGSLSLAASGALYPAQFTLKHWLKSHTPLGRFVGIGLLESSIGSR
jgi:sulfotransferase family protein